MNCNHEWKNPMITVKWIANRYLERIKANNKIPAKAIRQKLMKILKVKSTSTRLEVSK